MIGGQGADNLLGNSNDDILIAGLTTKDVHHIALVTRPSGAVCWRNGIRGQLYQSRE